MSTAGDLPDQLIPYKSTFQYVSAASLTIMVLVGFVIQIIIIVAIFSKGQRMTNGSRFILSLCFGDFLFCTVQSIYCLRNISQGGWYVSLSA